MMLLSDAADFMLWEDVSTFLLVWMTLIRGKQLSAMLCLTML